MMFSAYALYRTVILPGDPRPWKIIGAVPQIKGNHFVTDPSECKKLIDIKNY